MIGARIREMKKNYEIIINGWLSPAWSEIFDDLEVSSLPDGNTRLCGALPDQAALHGVLVRIRDLSLELISLKEIPPPADSFSDGFT